MQLVPVSEAKSTLTALLRDAEDHDVILTRHGRPAGVLISPARMDALMEQLDDLEDRLSVYEREDVGTGISSDKLKAELGLLD